MKKMSFSISAKKDKKNTIKRIQEEAKEVGITAPMYARTLLISGLREGIKVPVKEQEDKSETIFVALKPDQIDIYDTLVERAKKAEMNVSQYSRILIEKVLNKEQK